MTDLNYDAAGNITGYRNGEVLKQTKGGILNDRNEGTRLEDQRVRTLALRGEHVLVKLKLIGAHNMHALQKCGQMKGIFQWAADL